MRKAPTKKDFQYGFPNVGFNVGECNRALEVWAKEAEEYIKKLEHYRDTTVGLWATDRPKLVSDPKKLMFQIRSIK